MRVSSGSSTASELELHLAPAFTYLNLGPVRGVRIAGTRYLGYPGADLSGRPLACRCVSSRVDRVEPAFSDPRFSTGPTEWSKHPDVGKSAASKAVDNRAKRCLDELELGSDQWLARSYFRVNPDVGTAG